MPLGNASRWLMWPNLGPQISRQQHEWHVQYLHNATVVPCQLRRRSYVTKIGPPYLDTKIGEFEPQSFSFHFPCI
jgi:hypothetical protein